MEKDPAVQALGIKGVYQLQGGIDKYFKEFPDGGYWKGKNYVFDKRFAHKPPAQDAATADAPAPLSNCEACHKPWDKFRGKRRCPTCGVPSLICKACWQAHDAGTRKIGRHVRCDLCVAQNITSKRDWREHEAAQIQEYEARMQAKGLLEPAVDAGDGDYDTGDHRTQVSSSSASKLPPVVPNPNQVTRLSMRNLCRTTTTEESLLHAFPEITHIVWRTDHRTQQFLGQAWVEMATADAAAQAVARSGERLQGGRPVQITFQPPNGKDIWPPPKCAVHGRGSR